MIEKRAFPRHRVLKQGTIELRGGGGIECMVRNISQGGARLEVATPFGLHGGFTLVIASDHFVRDCRAVWNIEK
ncbi:MAG: PilZ domain-containing protein, partial [Bradyrhizobium sp.]